MGKPSVISLSLSEPNMLGFGRCRIEAELPFANMVTSKALGQAPLFALEEVLATEKAPTIKDIEDEMREH